VDTLGPMLADLRDAARTTIARCKGEEALPGLVSLQPGNTVSWDNCCEGGGTLWVRVVSADARPAGAQPCDITHLSVRAALGAVRCVHVVDEDGTFPTAEEMDGDTLATTGDADLLLRTLREWEPAGALAKFRVPKSLTIENGLPQGPQGGCAGWEWTFTFGLMLGVTADGC